MASNWPEMRPSQAAKSFCRAAKRRRKSFVARTSEAAAARKK
jgi:hypothetical protein